MRRTMTLEEFQRLPTEDVARLVREAGPKVCVFPINGTRRWFVLEHGLQPGEDFVTAYLDVVGRRHIELYRLFFDHGIDTLLTPVFGPDILEREGYEEFIERGLTWFAQDEGFLDFYEVYDVRVRIYGDARRYLQGTPYASALDVFDELAERTAAHRHHRLFFGVCAHDATEAVADIAVRFYQQHGRPPDRRQIVEAYYGEYVEPVDFFIGFDQLAAFDMPLIATGSEDLYFTVSPSPYLDAHTLRAILYDHLYVRSGEPDYRGLPADEWRMMRQFYRLNRRTVVGTGVRTKGGIWYPIGGIRVPDGFACTLLPGGASR